MTTIATECNRCPKGIESCAHLGDRVVWLADCLSVLPHEDDYRPKEHWQVVGPTTVMQCVCSVDHIVALPDELKICRTDSLPDAKTEYERRCALLRAEA